MIVTILSGFPPGILLEDNPPIDFTTTIEPLRLVAFSLNPS